MSIQQVGRCFYTPTLRPNQRLVAIALADYADDHGRAFPSLGNIAEKTGYSRRQTQRIVQELTELGYVEILIPATWNRTPLYQLHPDALAGRDRPTQAPLPLPPQDMIVAVQTPTENLIVATDGTEATVEAAEPRGDDNLTPPPGGDNLTPRDDTGGTQEVTNTAPGGDTGDTQTVIEPSQEPSPEIVAERFTDEIVLDDSDTVEPLKRPRNRAWDALTSIFEYEPEGSEAALWGKLSRAAHEAADHPEKGTGDPAAEILVRAKRLIGQWGAKALTPPSLLKHWDRFGSRLGAITEEETERLREEWDRAERRQRMAGTSDDRPALGASR